MVGLNKTKTRNSLGLDRTLSSIMTVKMTGLEPQCFKWESPTPIIKTSKCATNTYNRKKNSLSLSLSHTHTQLDIHLQGKFCKFIFFLFFYWCLVMSFWLKVCIYSHTRGVKLGLGLGFMQISQVLPH